MNQIINMIIKLLMRKTISRGIDAGFRAATTRRKAQPRPAVDDYGNVNEPDESPRLTPEEKRQMRQRRQAKKAARQAAKVTRRMTRL